MITGSPNTVTVHKAQTPPPPPPPPGDDDDPPDDDEPTTITISGTLLVAAEVNGNTLTLTFEDGRIVTYDLSKHNISITYEPGKFALSDEENYFVFTGNGLLIGEGATVKVTATKTSDSTRSIGAAAVGEKYEFTATAQTVADKTTFSIPGNSLPAGTYDITFEAAGNPHYSGILVRGYVHGKETPQPLISLSAVLTSNKKGIAVSALLTSESGTPSGVEVTFSIVDSANASTGISQNRKTNGSGSVPEFLLASDLKNGSYRVLASAGGYATATSNPVVINVDSNLNPTPNPSPSDSGGGGCNSGVGIAALALLSLPALKRKEK